MTLRIDPALDLTLERVVDVPVSLVWKAWTEPQHLMPWFCPRPWTTVACEIDLRPGGIFHTTMQSPEGERFPTTGCYLEVLPERRLVWTDALGPGFRPSSRGFLTGDGGFYVTGVITLESLGADRTRYVAHALHADPAGRDRHAAMGFHDGWGAALDQLVAYVKGW
ncbi:MAG TPA: SRPBCC family protein [Gemmatimonadaceae bacterium]|nr:SRPBCC family protein [Gemmatimonadaceae bacterium]